MILDKRAQQSISKAADLIMQADSLLIGAGAGIGVDSGLPDFRGNRGFWKAYPGLAKSSISFVEMANPKNFNQNPRQAWGFYGHRFNLYQRTTPHCGFEKLLKIAAQLKNGYQVFTSNVDGHFQTAGFAQERVVECHGSINYLQCSKPCSPAIWSAEGLNITTDDVECMLTSDLPLCSDCGAVARPNILMFGDFFWNSDRCAEQELNMQRHIDKMKKTVVIECGAGTAVPSVRHFCENRYAPIIRINPDEYALNGISGVSIAMGARNAIECIYQELERHHYF